MYLIDVKHFKLLQYFTRTYSKRLKQSKFDIIINELNISDINSCLDFERKIRVCYVAEYNNGNLTFDRKRVHIFCVNDAYDISLGLWTKRRAWVKNDIAKLYKRIMKEKESKKRWYHKFIKQKYRVTFVIERIR